jgi:hypothetical protein
MEQILQSDLEITKSNLIKSARAFETMDAKLKMLYDVSTTCPMIMLKSRKYCKKTVP